MWLTWMRSRSGAQPAVLPKVRVFVPALSGSVTLTVPTVSQPPVPGVATVTGAPPLTLICVDLASAEA